MRHPDIVAGVVMLALASLFIWGALQLPIGSPQSPEPGLVPLIQGVLLALAAAGLVTSSRRRAATPERVAWPTGNGKRMVLHISAALVGYLVLMTTIGFTLSTLLFLGAAGHAWRRYSAPVLLASAAAISVALYFTFSVLLQMPLPHNFLGLP